MGLTILEALAGMTAGMMTGNELCVSIFHKQLLTLDERAQFDLGRRSATVFGKLMPFWYAATLLLSGAVAYSLRGRGTAALLADLAAALFLVSIIYTVTLLVPISNRVASWQWETRPADWAGTADLGHAASCPCRSAVCSFDLPRFLLPCGESLKRPSGSSLAWACLSMLPLGASADYRCLGSVCRA